MRHKTAIIVVLYNGDFRYEVIEEDEMLILVDNTPGRVMEISGDAVYIPLKENKGIAFAQNVGIRRALESGADRLLFFDQDSMPEPSFVRKMNDEFDSIQNKDSKICALGPSVIDKDTERYYKGSSGYCGVSRRVESIISSGTLVPAAVIPEVGMMKESLFIDMVDHEWCWRAASKGYHIYQTGKIVIPHKVGSRSIHLLGADCIVSSPFRYYYRYRNSVMLSFVDYVPMKWKIKNAIRKTVEFFVLPVCSGNIIKSYGYMLKGIKDGLTGRKNI